ncbi:MAG: hypothetical protein AAF747_08315, partial [Planctomycetota bacterium]
ARGLGVRDDDDRRSGVGDGSEGCGHQGLRLAAHRDAGALQPIFGQIQNRLALRGIDMVEWAVLDGDQPRRAALDPERLRPIVYAVLSPDSTAAAREMGGLNGLDRAQRLGEALQKLAEDRASVLVSLNPSIAPSGGGIDPIASVLNTTGLRARTGTPILEEGFGSGGRAVATDIAAIAEASEHPLAVAVARLPTLMLWPVPLDIEQAGSHAWQPILSLDGRETRWAEAEWLRLWQTPRPARSAMRDAPDFDELRDTRDGPWVVAAAGQPREDAETANAFNRLVVVGSNGWQASTVAFASGEVDGRAALLYPGNAELFESAVLWLAGKDDQLGQSAAARSLPLISPIESGRLSAIRWLLIAGLPLLVLVVGVVVRVVWR